MGLDSEVMAERELKAWSFFRLALYAFAGLGLEAVLAFLVEPYIYGTSIKEWTVVQSICHWVLTCILWGIVTSLIIRTAKNKYGFDIFAKGKKLRLLQYILITVCICFMLLSSYIDWQGFKVLKEFQSNGLLKFVFQYIYYGFETALVLLIIVFSQLGFEKWFKKPNVPYGGIAVALTWGIAHIFTKGSVLAGFFSMVGGFMFGIAYLLVNRDIKKAYILLYVMFVL